MLTAVMTLMLAVSTPADAPSAWFLEDPARSQWCAFQSPQALEVFAKTLDLSKVSGGPGYGWAQVKAGRLSTIMLETVTDTATIDDQYLFDAKGAVTELLRSAHKVGGEEWVTFAYLPNNRGELLRRPATALAPEAEALAAWPHHARLKDIPFAGLIAIDGGKTTVREGCVRTPA